jgi:tetratricopeptide (TPR) repeat protein/tRNA A-37 threonylcarbamoyl transferase component Bud32
LTPERWHKIEAVFTEAEAAPREEQPAVLDRLCQGDPELRREVEQLLSEDPTGDSFESSIRAHVGNAFDAQGLTYQQRFGHYQLVRRIGQGGMGAVYEANRVDDFQKKVALKIIKQEFDSDFARARFQQERQLLATLEHPYICRLLDGGESLDGSPYLVLEFVDGDPIHRYAAKLDRTSQLRLFLKVCEAVEHAHRNLVIHRDLKPANILVTANGDPKLLDFGIAKLVDPSTSSTQTGVLALTPDYASPEQISGGHITTASDVYSLGVILYQLLTNRRPYTFDTSAPSEVERVICQREPAPPGLGDELDHILLMALRKEPERRYGSARQFAEDLERYLANQPVQARPDTAWYRARKYARRHWVGILTASAALLGICAAAGVAVYQARQAQRQFNQVRQLAHRFLFDVNDQIADTPGTVKARELIVSTALEYLNRLAADAAGNPGLQWELALAYGKVANAQGSTSGPSLSRPRDAAASYEKALSLARPLADAKLLDLSQQEALNKLLCDTEELYRFLRDFDAAARIGREAMARSDGLGPVARERTATEMATTLNIMGDLVGSVAAFERMLPVARENARRDPSWQNRLHVGILLTDLGVAEQRLTRFAEAARAEDEALTILRQLAVEHPDNARIRRSIHRALLRQGDILGAGDRPSQDKPAEAVASYQQSIVVMEPLIAADPNDLNSRLDVGLAHDKIAGTLIEIDPRKSLQHSALGTGFLDVGARDRPLFRAQARIMAGSAHLVLGNYADAERFLQEATRILNNSEPNTEADLALVWAQLETARRHRDLAAVWFDRTILLSEQLFKKTSTPSYAWNLAQVLEHAALAIPATAKSRRGRILAVWEDQNRRYPGHPYIEQRLSEAQTRVRLSP